MHIFLLPHAPFWFAEMANGMAAIWLTEPRRGPPSTSAVICPCPPRPLSIGRPRGKDHAMHFPLFVSLCASQWRFGKMWTEKTLAFIGDLIQEKEGSSDNFLKARIKDRIQRDYLKIFKKSEYPNFLKKNLKSKNSKKFCLLF